MYLDLVVSMHIVDTEHCGIAVYRRLNVSMSTNWLKRWLLRVVTLVEDSFLVRMPRLVNFAFGISHIGQLLCKELQNNCGAWL